MNYNTNSSDSKHQDIIKEILKNLYTFDIKDVDKLQDIILANQGRDTAYYIEKIDFHTFTKDSFNYLIQQINVHRNTFHGIGPFINKNGLWYSNKTDRNLEQIIESQTTIIQSQKKEIEELKQKLEFLEEII
jgi:hypothetical protein